MDVCSVCRFEFLHNISLRVSILLKTCVVEMLRDETRTTEAFHFQNDSRQTFKQLEKKVIRSMNKFFQ